MDDVLSVEWGVNDVFWVLMVSCVAFDVYAVLSIDRVLDVDDLC